ncbi:MAG: archaeal flagella assembly protein J [halophilic archaeon J07HB67]|jgi:Archaeal flagella assembly protein J|nr:MAG: archaeal flagella assembly protein J [halophilic archaeon J07HB67]
MSAELGGDEESGPLPDSVTDLFEDVGEAYDQLDIPRRRYVGYVLVPAAVFFLVTLVVALLMEFALLIRLPIVGLGALMFVAAAIYPKLYLNSRQVSIENKLHLLMTHMTVLSTTNIDRMEVFRTVADETEYDAAADEVAQVVHLVDTWNQSLDDALRRRAQQVPSDNLSDFFDRLGYTIAAGQELSEFLLSEQETVMESYITVYEGALSNLEVMKDLYMSMILSMTFALVFAIVLPILTGNNPTLTVSAVIVLFMLVQLGFYVAIRAMAPFDPLWFHSEEGAPNDQLLYGSFVVGVLSTFATITFVGMGVFDMGPGLRGILFFLEDIPLPLYVAIPITPMAITGIVVRLEEGRIKGRDEQFPSFIRALGAAESAKQSTTSDVLETLHRKDFGALSDSVVRLYRRLNMRLDASEAWYTFASDTRSYLIQKFSGMYLQGRAMGGDPGQLGELISDNMTTVCQLRQQRDQATLTLVGLLYGITAASSFAFFIGLQIVNILADFSEQLNISTVGSVGRIVYAGVYNIPLIEFLLLLVILFNAVLSSVMIRTIDGGNKANAYLHFVLLTWLGALTAIGTKALVAAVLSI